MTDRIVLFVRHGNTFGPGDRVVWVGNNEDLPLTAEGEDQAWALGAAFLSAGLVPDRFLVSPLTRTTRFAEIVKQSTQSRAPIEFDDRLREFDYGDWSGKTNDEIQARWGKEVLRLWSEQAVRPTGAGWSPEEAVVRAEMASLLDDLSAAPDGVPEQVCVVSSNGRLGVVHELLHGAYRSPAETALWNPSERRLKTGHFGIASYNGERWILIGWNLGAERERWPQPL